MAVRIEIGFREGIRDALGEKIRRRIVQHLQIPVDDVKTIDVYTIDGDLTADNLEAAAQGPLSDPVTQRFRIGAPLAAGFDWLIEVGFRPGVTDNVGKTAGEAIRLLLSDKASPAWGVYTSRQYLIRGPLGRTEVERIAANLLANELIERYVIIDGAAWNRQIAPFIPRVGGEGEPKTEEIDLAVDDGPESRRNGKPAGLPEG
jgi:phosphoribosylformylglycinamidine (FGAM) synthase PurS component